MMTKTDLMEYLGNICSENGWHYMIVIDDGKGLDYTYRLETGSQLHMMQKSVNEISDTYKEKTLKGYISSIRQL